VTSSRVFRFVEGSLVVLFVLQAARIALALLLSGVTRALDTGAVDVVLAPVACSEISNGSAESNAGLRHPGWSGSPDSLRTAHDCSTL
jgi:hypothetical protein